MRMFKNLKTLWGTRNLLNVRINISWCNIDKPVLIKDGFVLLWMYFVIERFAVI